MNDLDRVLFMGTADWTKARLYQWHKEGYWTELAPGNNTIEYMEAIKDITEGAPDGIFSNVFCQVLFAQQAAINTLQSQLIQIGNAIFGGPRFTKSGDTVVDNDPDGSEGLTGVMIGADGHLLASNAVFNGVTIRSGYGVNNLPSIMTLLKSISGYAQATITLDSGWYYVDMAGGGGGNGGDEAYQNSSAKGAKGGCGGKAKYMFNIMFDGVICYIYSGSMGGKGDNYSGASMGNGGLAGKGWKVDIFNDGEPGGIGGEINGTGRGASFNNDNAQKGKNNYTSSGGGGGNSILYIPALGLIIFCSGGGGGDGAKESGTPTTGSSGKDSIYGNTATGNNENGYVKIFKL
jgi:hypothetical protein